MDVINGPYACKADAEALLTTIETHEAEGRKQMARRAFENGLAAFSASNYAQALAVFKQIDPMQLPATSRAEMKDKTVEAVTKLKAEDDLKAALANGGTVKPSPRSPAAELPNPAPRGGADNLVKQQEALSQVEFQKLRSEALKLESDATARFGRGETDAALGDMDKFVAKVKATTLEPNKQAMLVRPIEARMDRLRIVKHQTDFLTKESRDRRNFNSSMTQEAMYREKKHEEVTALLKQANKLNEEAKYREAMVCLEEAKTMDPDDPSINGTLQMTKLMFRKKEFKRVSDSQEKWIWETGNEWKDIPAVSGRMPLLVDDDKDHREQVRLRSRDAGGNVPRSRNEKEKEIERKMSTPVNLNFKGMPLTDVVDHMASYTNINFVLDLRGLKEGNVDPSMPITANLTTAVSLKSALNIICQQAGLKHVIENEAIRITTAKNATGRQQVKTLSVGDLVIPAMNATPKPVYDLASQLELASGIGQNRMSSNPSPRLPGNGLNGGSGVGSGSNATMASGSGRLLNTPMDGGVKSNSINHNGTLERELIHLLTTTIKPDSWREMGGDGTIEYFPLTLALVINQSPEVIEEVERLLESLRKLQDLEVSIEVKVVSLAETFYERIGVDFAMGIKTNAKALNGSITGVNNRNFSGNVVGLAVPGVPTPDLDIPIRATSFAKAIPPFGGFTNSFADGGLSLGLAFLSDIQVQMFLEAAQGDTRTNVMQAPKLTALNGTSAAMTVGDVQFFLTGITVSSVNGQLVFTPQNQPFSVGLTQPAQQQQGQGGVAPLQNTVPGLGLFIQPVVSADRRFVRLNIQQSFTSLVSGSQQIPLTTIITPAFENGGQGQPIPFTQFLQQPRFSNLETQTVVVVPDGGTVVMGGLKYMTEGRNEFGPPVLSKIPYLNRLFKNVAYGREGRSILIMVTPRIIINREEQEKQTGVRDDDVAGGLTGQ